MLTIATKRPQALMFISSSDRNFFEGVSQQKTAKGHANNSYQKTPGSHVWQVS